MTKISQKYIKQSEIYKGFAIRSGLVNLDFSESALAGMYEYESFGKGNLASGLFSGNKINGFAYGKHLLNLTVAMWREDIEHGLLFIEELYNDKSYSRQWLDKVLRNVGGNSV